MLDSETNNIPQTEPADAAEPAPPPRKRATRKRTAAAPSPEAAEKPEQTEPRTKAPRTRVARKASAATPESVPTSGEPPARPRKRAAASRRAAPDAETEQTAAAPEPGADAADIGPAPAPAAKKPTRKRTAKKAAVPPEAAAEEPLPPSVARAVVFQPPVPAAEPTPADADITAAEDLADQTAEPEDVREVAAEQASGARRRRRRGRRGRGGATRGTGETAADTRGAGTEPADTEPADTEPPDTQPADTEPAGTQPAEAEAADAEPADAELPDGAATGTEPAGESASTRRRRRRRRSAAGETDTEPAPEAGDPAKTVVHVREKRAADDGVRAVKGSTRLEAKRQRRRDGRATTRRRAPILTEAEFLARREAVDRVMAVRQQGERTQIAVLEDGVLVEHYVTRASSTSYVGNVYLGRVQNVLPSMEAAFIDIGKGRNGVLYAGEVNWDAAGLEGKARAIEQALKSGDTVLVQVTKDPIGHKGARLTSQISLPGRFLVYVPGGGMTGISRRLPDTERHRLKAILRKIVPDEAGVIVRTAAEGATEDELRHDVERLRAQWEAIAKKAKSGKNAPMLVHGEPDLAIRVVRDVFNEDFKKLIVEGKSVWDTLSEYLRDVAPDLAERASQHVGSTDLFAELRVDEQLLKALDRKVWLPSGGSLIIDRTEAMTVIDVNTGKFVGAGGNLEQTVTRNNLEAAEEIVRQLRLRDVGGIVVIDFIDMVLESNRDLVLRRLVECLGRDRTKHQVAEVTSLGLVQMTRKRVGEGLLEAFSEPCEVCHGRGVIVHTAPLEQPAPNGADGRADEERPKGRRKRRGKGGAEPAEPAATPEQRQAASAAIAAVHRAASGDAAVGEPGEEAGVVDELAGNLVAAALNAQQEPAAVDEADRRDEPEEPTAAAMEAVARAEIPGAPAARGRGRRTRRAATRPAGPPVPAAG